MFLFLGCIETAGRRSIFTRVAKSWCSGRITLKCCRRPYSVSASASSMSAMFSTDTRVPKRQSSLWLAKSNRANSGSNDSRPHVPPARWQPRPP